MKSENNRKSKQNSFKYISNIVKRNAPKRRKNMKTNMILIKCKANPVRTAVLRKRPPLPGPQTGLSAPENGGRSAKRGRHTGEGLSNIC